MSTAQAQVAARAPLAELVNTPYEGVGYRSSGRVLVISGGGDARAAHACAQLSAAGLRCLHLVTDGVEVTADAPAESRQAGQGAPVQQTQHVYAALAVLRGHLGGFEVDIAVQGETRPLAPSLLTANAPLDLVLDLGEVAAISAALPPPGYFHAGDDAAVEHALAELPDLVGDFEKPRYFQYDASICAHGRNGLPGCTRCLDACPADAITSVRDRIEVDPYLCQGGGVCATACPTGAITYTMPPASTMLDALRGAITVWREAGATTAPLVVFAAEATVATIEWPAHVLPVPVEEPGAAGLDAWLCALAYGAGAVRVLLPADAPAGVVTEMNAQLAVCDALLAPLGLGGRVAFAALADELPGAFPDRAPERAPDSAEDAPPAVTAGFAATGSKRQRLQLAIDAIARGGGTEVPTSIPLPAHAPFGAVEVDGKACTLCMGCVSTCPAGALIAGGDRPVLQFVEQNCVQCGLCERACPEDAITRAPRYLLDAGERSERRILNEDRPWPCPECGKVFATASIIERIREKLSSHWMYADNPDQLRRLELCEECRVKDLYRDGGGILDVH